MKYLTLVLFAAAAVAATPAPQKFIGVVTDSTCDRGDHSQMRMGPTDAECAKACNSDHGSSYVLFDGRDSYTLSDQRTAVKFLAQKVSVTGTLDAKTKIIQVDSIAAVK
jgi:hypothetical protein